MVSLPYTATILLPVCQIREIYFLSIAFSSTYIVDVKQGIQQWDIKGVNRLQLYQYHILNKTVFIQHTQTRVEVDYEDNDCRNLYE